MNRFHDTPFGVFRLSRPAPGAGPRLLPAVVAVPAAGGLAGRLLRDTTPAGGTPVCSGCQGRGWKVASPRRALRAPGDGSRLVRRACPDCGGADAGSGQPEVSGRPDGAVE